MLYVRTPEHLESISIKRCNTGRVSLQQSQATWHSDQIQALQLSEPWTSCFPQPHITTFFRSLLQISFYKIISRHLQFHHSSQMHSFPPYISEQRWITGKGQNEKLVFSVWDNSMYIILLEVNILKHSYLQKYNLTNSGNEVLV